MYLKCKLYMVYFSFNELFTVFNFLILLSLSNSCAFILVLVVETCMQTFHVTFCSFFFMVSNKMSYNCIKLYFFQKFWIEWQSVLFLDFCFPQWRCFNTYFYSLFPYLSKHELIAAIMLLQISCSNMFIDFIYI